MELINLKHDFFVYQVIEEYIRKFLILFTLLYQFNWFLYYILSFRYTVRLIFH